MEDAEKERVKEFYRWTKLSCRAFANKVNMPQRTVYGYLIGGTKMPQAFVNSVLKAWPELDEEWVKTGNGCMLKGAEPFGVGFNQPIEDPKVSLYKQLVDSLRAQIEMLNSKCASLESQIELLNELRRLDKDKK